MKELKVIILILISHTLINSNVCYASDLNQLPGYKLKTQQIPFLKDYKIEDDEIDYDSLNSLGVQRELVFAKKDSKIYINIYVSQSKELKPVNIISNIINRSSRTVSNTFNKQDHKAIGVGENLYTYQPKIKNSIGISLLFSRNNIVVEITDRSKKRTLDLKPIAEQIDKDIDNKVKITFKEIESHQPIIEEFYIHKNEIKPYTETKLEIKIKDPNKMKTYLFFKTKGEVIKENNQYLLDSPIKPGKETLTIIVINDNLLYSKKTIEFTVIK